LFFGTGEKMLNDIDIALRRETSCVILDLRRLTEIDSTGASVLLELRTRLAHQNKNLLLVAARQTMATERLESFNVLSSIGKTSIFPDVDRAIERAEHDLLRVQTPHFRAEMPLAEVGLFAGFSATELTAIASHLKRVSYHTGTVIFREGDHGNEVLIVTKGTASAYLQMPNSNIRVATFAP